jgi:hypothetical protein
MEEMSLYEPLDEALFILTNAVYEEIFYTTKFH